MKKILLKITCFFLCLFSFSLVSCTDDNKLYEKGIQLTTIMEEMIKSEYYSDLVGGENLNTDILLANDYDTPIRVYSLTIPDTEQLLEITGTMDNEQWNSLSDTLKDQIKSKYGFLAVINYLNFSYTNSSTFALSSVYTAYLQFNGRIDSQIAYLYVFETGTPIIVIFTPNGDKQFSATGYFFFSNQCTSLSNVRDIFEPFGCNVENIN